MVVPADPDVSVLSQSRIFPLPTHQGSYLLRRCDNSYLHGSTKPRRLFDRTNNPPTITIHGDNPAIIHVGDTYADLGAAVSDAGPGRPATRTAATRPSSTARSSQTLSSTQAKPQPTPSTTSPPTNPASPPPHPNHPHRTSRRTLNHPKRRCIDYRTDTASTTAATSASTVNAIIKISTIDGKTRPHRRQQWPSHTTLPCHL